MMLDRSGRGTRDTPASVDAAEPPRVDGRRMTPDTSGSASASC